MPFKTVPRALRIAPWPASSETKENIHEIGKSMTKKPKLTVVPSSLTGTPPPRKLGRPGTALWQSINSEYVIDDAGGIETLLQVCAAADRLEDIAKQIEADGLVIRSKTGVKEHPLLKMELGLRSFITRNLMRLGINIEPVKPVGRPGRGIGITWQDIQQEND
jgi:hypothetical protein